MTSAPTGRVPLLDFSQFRSGDRAAFTRHLDAVCRDIGFVVVTGHGVAPGLLRAMHAVSTAFFARPESEKRHLRVAGDRIHGWTGPRQSYLADTLADGAAAPPDWKEGFSIGPPAPPEGMTPQEAPYFTETRFPSGVPGFSETWSQYYRAMERLAAELMAAMACALGLPAAYFAPFIDRHITGLSVQFYPPQPTAAASGQLRAGAHTDFGSLTILHPGDNPGGLQVRDHDGAWRDVAAPWDAFVVNIGDLMAQWTNDRWVSTLHRVLNPPPGRAHLPRQSIAFFHQPNWHAKIAALPGCGAPRYAPITSGAHFERKLAALRGADPAPPG